MSRKSAARRRAQQQQQSTPETLFATPQTASPYKHKKAAIIFVSIVALVLLLLGCIYGIARAQFANRPQSEFVFSQTSGITAQETGSVLYQNEVYTQRKNIYTVLFIGIDRSEDRIDSGYADASLSLADTLVVASIDLDTAEISLLSIPRDTMVTIYTHTREGEHNGYLSGQIATQFTYGGDSDDLRNEHTVESVERLLCGLEIDSYVTVDMDDIIAITDLIGGVPVTVPEDEYYCSYTGYEVGQWMLLEGESALQFVQYRDTAVFASCEMRVERQKVFLDGAINRLYNLAQADLLEAASIAWDSYNMLDTDLSLLTVAFLAQSLLDFEMQSITMETLPGQASSTDLYEEFYCDTDALQLLLLDFYYEKATS